VNLHSDNHEKVEKFVKYVKSRPEMDIVISYGLDDRIIAGLVRKHFHFQFFMINVVFALVSTSKKGDLNHNYNRLTLKFRKMTHTNLIKQMKVLNCFNFLEIVNYIEQSR